MVCCCYYSHESLPPGGGHETFLLAVSAAAVVVVVVIVGSAISLLSSVSVNTDRNGDDPDNARRRVTQRLKDLSSWSCYLGGHTE